MFFRTATIASLISQRYFSSKIALDINNHFQNTGQALCLDKFPNSFLTSTSIKDPKALYVANHIAANAIVDSIKCFHKENLVFFEVNPGSCILSELLIEHLKLKRLYLLESNDVFEEYQKEFIRSHKETTDSKFSGDVNIILPHIEKKAWQDEIVGQLFSFIPGARAINKFISNVINQDGVFSKGRLELFFLIPPFEYKKLMSSPESGYKFYTSKSCIFQILFECEVLKKMSKKHFLPWWNRKTITSKNMVDDDSDLLYLIRVEPRQNLSSLCEVSDLLALKFFINQCFFKRTGSIVAKLEQWMPGSGIDLITFNTESTNSKSVIVGKNEKKSIAIDVFTQCGMLTPSQILNLFQFFKQTPKYKMSGFHQLLKGKHPDATS